MTDHKHPGNNESQDRLRHEQNEKKHGPEHNHGHGGNKDQKHGRPHDRKDK